MPQDRRSLDPGGRRIGHSKHSARSNSNWINVQSGHHGQTECRRITSPVRAPLGATAFSPAWLDSRMPARVSNNFRNAQDANHATTLSRPATSKSSKLATVKRPSSSATLEGLSMPEARSAPRRTRKETSSTRLFSGDRAPHFDTDGQDARKSSTFEFELLVVEHLGRCGLHVLEGPVVGYRDTRLPKGKGRDLVEENLLGVGERGLAFLCRDTRDRL